MPRLSHDERVRIVTLRNDAGWTLEQLADHFNVHKRSVQRLLEKHRTTESVDDRPHARRPRVSTVREDRALIRMSANAPTQFARQLRSTRREHHGVQASVATVKR